MSIGMRLRRSVRSKRMCSAIGPRDHKDRILEPHGPPRLQLFIESYGNQWFRPSRCARYGHSAAFKLSSVSPLQSPTASNRRSITCKAPLSANNMVVEQRVP